MNAASTYPIAVALGSRDVHAIQFEGRRGKLKVRAASSRELESDADSEDRDAELRSALRAFRMDPAFHGRAAAMLLPLQEVFSLPVRFRVNAGEAVEEAVVREASKALPFPIEDALIDYASLEETGKGATKEAKAVIVAARREGIDRYTALAEQARLRPEVVDFSVSALLRLHLHIRPEPETPVVLCCIGRSQSLLCVVEAHRVIAHRNVNWGIDRLTDALLSQLKLSGERDNAVFLLREQGLVYESCVGAEAEDTPSPNNISRTVYQLCSPPLEGFAHELHNLTAYVRSESPGAHFEAMYLYGHASSIKDIGPFLAGRVGLTTEVVDPATRLPGFSEAAGDSTDAGAFSLALGLGMRRVPWL